MENTVEREYKWKADDTRIAAVLEWASARSNGQSRTIRMRSRYYDTADRLLARQGVGLRLRQENDQSVCCMKIRGKAADDNADCGLRQRAEYQCNALTITEGLALLPTEGAPVALCREAAAAPLELICEVDFTRCAILIQHDNTVCEMACDRGEMRREDRRAPLCEIELEFVAGDEAVFHQIAAKLAGKLSLVPEPESKLARASQL